LIGVVEELGFSTPETAVKESVIVIGCYNGVLLLLSCPVNMNSINFPNIDHENLPKWEGDLAPLECIEIIEETHNVKSFRFKSQKDAWFQFLPGQHTTLFLNIDGADVMRTYTIASSPTRPHTITITSKRMSDGVVTNWMHDNLKVGDVIDALNIGGSFSVALDKPRRKVLLMSGGSGITPMLSMTRYFVDLAIDVDIVFVHNAQTPEDLIGKYELDYYAHHQSNFELNYVCDKADTTWQGESGYLNADMLTRMVPDYLQREVYCCGPEAYMVNAKGILQASSFDMSCYHQESFDIESSTAQQNMAEPNAELVQAPNSDSEIIEYRVTLTETGRTISCDSNSNILSAIQAKGIGVSFACSMGMCGTCRVKMTGGTVDMETQGGLLKSHEEEGYILTCCSHPTSDVVLDL
jgi:ferredoxin-NADP reductase